MSWCPKLETFLIQFLGCVLLVLHSGGQLVYIAPKTPKLNAVPNANFSYGVSSIDLTGHNITLQVGDFPGLDQLSTLVLASNRLVSLEPEAFRDLAILTSLSLSKNSLTAIPNLTHVSDTLTELLMAFNTINPLKNGSFAGFTALEHLDLSDCGIKEVQRTALFDLTSLKTLLMHNNGLRVLHFDVFRDLRSIQDINFYYNGIKQLPRCNLSTLDLIDLGENKIERIEQGVFDGATALRDISLWSCRLKSWPHMGNAAHSVKKISFSASGEMTDAPYNATSEYYSLQEAHIFGNKFTRLPCLVGSSMTLRTLEAYDNQIETIDAQCLDNFAALTYLSLDNNYPLNNFPRVRLPSLRTLYMSDGDLTSFPDLTHCPEARVIHMRSHRISSLNASFLSNMQYLRDLELHHNLLTEFPDFRALPDGNTLEKLDLRDNLIPTIPPERYSTLTGLKVLVLADNRLDRVPSILNVSNGTLWHLDLSRNNIHR